jgi:tricorn protease
MTRLLIALIACVGTSSLAAQVDARLLRQPDVSATHIVFVYAGDLWVVPKAGGTALRLSSPPGEEQFPRFSPDGSRIAFSANYDGNLDVYVVPTMGGTPTRVTHHPMGDRLVDWYPSGADLLIASPRAAGRQRFNQLFRVPTVGGLPVMLPMPYGEFGAMSPDGRQVAYMPKSRDFRTWKRYRGGWAPDIWLFDLRDSSARNLTTHAANDAHPMWHGATMYFLSDRGPEERYNLWAMDMGGGDAARQVTRFTDFDITFPAIGPEDIVFEAGGRLHLMGLANEQVRAVDVRVVTDLATLRPRTEAVTDLISWVSVGPTGERAVFEARGDLFTVPAEHGPVLNVTQSSGVAERYPAWSPDGQTLAYWSDRSGEYQLMVRPAGGGAERALTRLGAGFRYAPWWSPDSKKLAFVDQSMRIRIYDMDANRVTDVDQALYWFHGALQGFRPGWSPDSRWLAYSRDLPNRQSAIFLFDTQDRRAHQVTSGYYSDATPVFDPDGKYLYFLSNRTFQPIYSDVDNSWIYPNTTNIVAVPLRPDVPSPLAPRNDMEGGDSTQADSSRAVTLEGFERRVVVLPPQAGNYTDLSAASGKVVYRRLPRSGSGATESPIVYYDLAAREETTVLADADAMILTHDGKKLLARDGNRYAMVELRATQRFEDPMRVGEMTALVDPRAEWRQIFQDAWRFQRDYFYDPNLHGVDWDGMRERYGALIEQSVTRWDVDFVLGELIAELNASHTYRGGGDQEQAPFRPVGLLGVDWVVANGAYRIARIVEGAPWDADVRSPLSDPTLGVRAGDYVLAVNGIRLEPATDPYAAFAGLANRTVTLTVNGRPTMDGAREVLVQTLASEAQLRHLAWIEANRRRVEEATGGRVGYVYVESTGVPGQTALVRQFAAQLATDALIVDERFNSGGQIPDRFIELLDRDPLVFWAVRDGRDWAWPPAGHFGPKVMLINGWSGSGGDAFPHYFRQRELGPLIGERTWGGLIGISGAPGLVDGGNVTVPTFRQYDPDGTWFPEGHGVEPDIPVVDDPAQLARGVDPQLERAIAEILRLLEANPPARANRPPYERRIP